MRVGDDSHLTVDDIVINTNAEGPDGSPPHDWGFVPIVNDRPGIWTRQNVADCDLDMINEHLRDARWQTTYLGKQLLTSLGMFVPSAVTHARVSARRRAIRSRAMRIVSTPSTSWTRPWSMSSIRRRISAFQAASALAESRLISPSVLTSIWRASSKRSSTARARPASINAVNSGAMRVSLFARPEVRAN